MSSVLLVFATSFAALCVWLTVRIVNRRERWTKCALVGVLIGPPVLYAVTYALMVRPFPFVNVHGESSIPGPHVYLLSVSYEADLPLIGRVWMGENWDQFFAPIHELDLKLRPEMWYLELSFPPPDPASM